jgi:hypothetical protein
MEKSIAKINNSGLSNVEKEDLKALILEKQHIVTLIGSYRFVAEKIFG